jgi:hypothetical protein
VARPSTRLERLERYLSGLPGGLAAYPHCLAKGALVRNLLERELVPPLLSVLPEPLRRLVAEPPMGSEWIPEVHFGALLLAIADAVGRDDADLLLWSRNRNRALFRSRTYKILMAVASPAQLIRFAGARWANWHRGSTLEVEGIGDDGVHFALRFPPGLFDPTLQLVYAESIIAALELANARVPRVEVTSRAPGMARYRAAWG